MQPTSHPRRFIAGAVCPRCAVMDRIVMYRDGEQSYRECVSCGFKEKLVVEAPQEPETRVTRERKPEPAAQAIKFFPNPNRAKKD